MGSTPDVMRSREHVAVEVFSDSSHASTFVAQQIIDLVRETREKGMLYKRDTIARVCGNTEKMPPKQLKH